MTDVQIFKNDEFGEIRTSTIDNEPYFVGKDVANILGYADPSSAVSKNVDSEDKTTLLLEQDGSNYKSKTTFINESGLYSLILSSKLPNAKKFKRWVTHEVLPSIRQNGGYIMNQEQMTPEQILANAIIVANNVIENQKKQLEEKEKTIKLQNKEIIYKEDVIAGLTDDIDLATKLQRITQIVRHNARNNFQERYALLYSEFEKKYHCDLKRRMLSDEAQAIKPKIKNKMDYIDRGMNKIPQLYEICCKLFENDVKSLMKIWEDTI